MNIQHIPYGFSPLQIPGCLFWLEADRGITLDESGKVSAWADQSGNSRHVSQSDPGLRPAYNLSGLNGNPTITIPDSKYLTGSMSGFSGYSNYTMTSVWKYTGSLVTGTPRFPYDSSSKFCRLQIIPGSSALYAYVGGGSNYCSWTDNNVHVVNVSFSGYWQTAVGKLTIAIDNVTRTMLPYLGITTSTNDIGTLYVGCFYSSGVNYFLNGELAMICIHLGDVPQSVLLQMNRFYGRKYGIIVS
jgi:hypothetical protein